MNIVLFSPEIPQNTGNIARTCASTGTVLHLIKPLGFAIDNAKLKRAGLDYWHSLDIRYHDGYDAFTEKEHPKRVWLLTTKAKTIYTQADYQPDDYLLFGQETAGLPEAIHYRYPNTRLRIPMTPENRSLNLSNAAAIVLYEALRKTGFNGLL